MLRRNVQDFDQLSTYDYTLPEELIAKVPLPTRDSSRLMVVSRSTGQIQHRLIRDLPDLLSPSDCVIVNNSQVLPARLLGQRVETGGKWEGLYLGSEPDGCWNLIGQTRGYLRIGEFVLVRNSSGEELKLQLVSRQPEGVFVFRPDLDQSPFEVLRKFGTLPLPPYMDRKTATTDDLERYQTVYATHPGSIAAPTAGLHFTTDLVKQCGLRGITFGQVTLHVGLGTFRPVSVENLQQHQMHSEWCELPQATAELIQETRTSGGRIVAIGTTSLRTLESAALAQTPLKGWSGETQLFVRPPYQFQLVDVLLTNFHLPKSTLLMLVSAFAGVDLISQAYQTAIAEKYRFFSYGDAMLIV